MAPVPAPTTPPITAPLAVLLQPFLAVVPEPVWVSPDPVSAEFPDEEDADDEDVFLEVADGFASLLSFFSPNSFCAFLACYSANPVVSVEKRSESES